MRLGLNSFLYASPFTDAQAGPLLRKAAAWGFDTLEVAIEDPAHVTPARLRAQAGKAGIAIGSVCAALGPGRDLRGTAAELLHATAGRSWKGEITVGIFPDPTIGDSHDA